MQLFNFKAVNFSTFQLENLRAGPASGRFVLEEVRVPTAARGAAAGAARGDGQRGGSQPQLPSAESGRVRFLLCLIHQIYLLHIK